MRPLACGPLGKTVIRGTVWHYLRARALLGNLSAPLGDEEKESFSGAGPVC